MKLNVMDVTPSQAKSWLKMNTLNRPVRKFYVNALAEAMKRGEFVPNHQAIALNGAKLIDGQHRLMAVIASGLPSVKMSVITDADSSTFETIDIGAKRTHADIFREDRHVMNPISYVARLVYMGHVTPAMTRPIYDKIHRQMREIVNSIPRTTRGFTASAVRVGALAAILNGEDKTYVLSLYKAMAEFDTKNLPPIAAAFVKQIMIGKTTATGNVVADLLVRAYTVFQKENAENTRLSVKDASVRASRIREVFRKELSI